ncbi:DUF1127 domain-containing protein [Aestuariispira insulae]|uniref:Uncharacterized protein DUF1127 n=1 Tax=Aestuariispira insulae TaxID=1461337 RepID=A0A3D9HJJ9_9PROT|nr:DUF1127 domain-containing protein [Aestuariispira insulae]RED49086.1 uncharacterized protein DUF1127 [Aestuariispira insulae]
MTVTTYNQFVSAHPLADALMRATLAIGGALVVASDAFVKAYRQARTRSELEALSADQLADIGLERTDIDAVVARI